MHTFLKPKQILSIYLCAPLGALLAQTPTDAVETPVSYEIALERALQNDPVLRSFETRYDAAEGQVEQAGLRPNPVVGVEMENAFGTGPFRDVQGAELTLCISQLIETAGKRSKRSELARSEKSLIDWERELRVANLEADVRAAFVDVLLAQESIELREAQLELTERSQSETQRLVEAARSSEVELSRSNLAVRQQDFALQQAQRNLAAARGRLAVLWGDSLQTEYRVTGSVQLDSQVPELAELTVLLPQTAYIAQYESHLLNRESALTLEKANARQDFEVFGGGRYFNEQSGDAAFVVGVQIPWPIFDKNQGNIRSARAELRGVEYEKAITRRELLRALADAYQTLVAAHEEAASLQADLLPSAEHTLKESEKAYEQGRFTLLSVLESRATLFQIREAYLDALGRYATAQARIQALTRPASIK